MKIGHFRRFMLFMTFMVPFLFALPAAAEAPAELTRLREAYDQRAATAMNPVNAHFLRELRGLQRRFSALGRTADAVAIQHRAAALTGEALAPGTPSEPAPQELQALERDLEVRTRNALQPVDAWYQSQLQALQRRYTQRGDLAGAAAVGAEMEGGAVDGATSSRWPSGVDWQLERERVRYRYEEDRFARGSFDYTDHNRIKLLDGQTQPRASDNSVGSWINEWQIIFIFQTPVMPSEFRLYAQGGGVAMINVPRTVVVRTGTRSRPGTIIGRVDAPHNHSGWINVPLTLTQPENIFWIELIRADRSLLMIDEVEFH